MQEVKIKQISFVNGISGCPGTSINENLMEQFKSELDIGKFKEVLSLSLKELSRLKLKENPIIHGGDEF